MHAFDVLRYLIGSEVAEVAALVDSEPGFQVDTTALVLLRFSTGTLGYVNANQSVPYARDDIVLYGTEGRVLGRNLSRPGPGRHAQLITRDGDRGSSRHPPGTPTAHIVAASPTPSPAAATPAHPARTGCAAWNSPRPSRRRSGSAGWSRSAAEPAGPQR